MRPARADSTWRRRAADFECMALGRGRGGIIIRFLFALSSLDGLLAFVKFLSAYIYYRGAELKMLCIIESAPA
jgi:hypothetical protein